MCGWDILLVFVLFFCLCSSYKVSQSAGDWLKIVLNLSSQVKFYTSIWVDQIKAVSCPTLWLQHYRNKNNVVVHQNAFAAHGKRYGMMLVVLIENKKNTCETNDCDIIKQRLNELMRWYCRVCRDHCHNEHSIWTFKRIDDVHAFSHSNGWNMCAIAWVDYIDVYLVLFCFTTVSLFCFL